MKFSVLAFAVTAVLSSPAYAFFGLGDADTQESTYYKIETRGYDIRAYESRSVVNPSVLCVSVFSTGSGPVGTFCVNTGSTTPVLPNQGTIDSTGYKVETRGYDTRTYEWNLINAPEYVCRAVFANAGNAGMHCAK